MLSSAITDPHRPPVHLDCNPEMLQAQNNEAVRSGRAPKRWRHCTALTAASHTLRRSPSRQNYDKINQQSDLPGALAGSKTGGHSNPEGWTTSMRAPSNMCCAPASQFTPHNNGLQGAESLAAGE